MKVDKALSIINYIFCSVLAVSVFIGWIPIDDGGCLGLITGFIQVFVVFYFHNVLKEKKPYYVFTLLLALSNVVNYIIYFICTQNSIKELDNVTATGNPYDSFWVSMIPALLEVMIVAVLVVTVIVVVECAISMFLKYRYYKSIKNDII
ncbi:MAG: hypothetical protein UHD05_03370 [Ruminococcus sp.]|nr:hypothetical protein [Ruminococcus sp.]